jgi:hypothetical protein
VSIGLQCCSVRASVCQLVDRQTDTFCAYVRASVCVPSLPVLVSRLSSLSVRLPVCLSVRDGQVTTRELRERQQEVDGKKKQMQEESIKLRKAQSEVRLTV